MVKFWNITTVETLIKMGYNFKKVQIIQLEKTLYGLRQGLEKWQIKLKTYFLQEVLSRQFLIPLFFIIASPNILLLFLSAIAC